MRREVESSGVSQSKWIADLNRQLVAYQWDESVRHLAGAWSDLPTADEIRSGVRSDVEREPV